MGCEVPLSKADGFRQEETHQEVRRKEEQSAFILGLGGWGKVGGYDSHRDAVYHYTALWGKVSTFIIGLRIWVFMKPDRRPNKMLACGLVESNRCIDEDIKRQQKRTSRKRLILYFATRALTVLG